MKKRKMIALIALLVLTVTTICGCREAERVSYNISQEADNFNVIRRLSVINARTDKPVVEIVGAFSFTLEDDRIVLIVETGPNEYKKHSVGINEWTIWDIEDISGASVSKYHYEVNFLPEMIVPIEFTSKD